MAFISSNVHRACDPLGATQKPDLDLHSPEDERANSVLDSTSAKTELSPSSGEGPKCVAKEEKSTAVAQSSRKPCIIKLFKGDDLDEDFVYTDGDMLNIISRIVNEDIECFEIEEVQSAAYDRLKFIGPEKEEGENANYENIVHKTPIRELFSMIEFLRGHVQATYQRENNEEQVIHSDVLFEEGGSIEGCILSEDSPLCEHESYVPNENSEVGSEGEYDHSSPIRESSIDAFEEKSVGSRSSQIDAEEELPLDEKLAEVEAPLGDETVSEVDGSSQLASSAPMENAQIRYASAVRKLVTSVEQLSEDISSRAVLSSRPKLPPLDLSSEAKIKPQTCSPMSAIPVPLTSRLDAALQSPLTPAKVQGAAAMIEEIIRRYTKYTQKIERANAGMRAITIRSLA